MRPGSLPRAAFARAFETGRSRRFSFFTLRWTEGEGRLGVAVSRKARTKPNRNGIKRRVLAALAECGTTIARFDVVISVDTRVRTMDYEALRSALLAAVQETIATGEAERILNPFERVREDESAG